MAKAVIGGVFQRGDMDRNRGEGGGDAGSFGVERRGLGKAGESLAPECLV